MFKNILKLFRNWLFLFGIFVPYGYLDWWFAIPVSFACFCAFVSVLAGVYKDSKNES